MASCGADAQTLGCSKAPQSACQNQHRRSCRLSGHDPLHSLRQHVRLVSCTQALMLPRQQSNMSLPEQTPASTVTNDTELLLAANLRA